MQDIVRADGPNILLVMSDQHRADWLGCAGAHWIRTPNIDRLAREGVRFANASCDSPVCAPSRSALASGLPCSEVGVLSNRDLYPLDVPTYYQALRAAGYRVGCIGKTDLHKRDHWEGIHGDRPLMYHLGFTDPKETEGKCSAARYATQAVCPYTRLLVERDLARIFRDDYARRSPAWHSGDSVLPLDCYHDHYIGQSACQFLQTVEQESPWHYFVSFVGPHDPWDAPAEYSRRYIPEDMPASDVIQDTSLDKPANQIRRRENHSSGLTEERLSSAMAHYAGMITLIDDFVGRFVEILRARGSLEDTVIIYTSDHGEMMGDHGMFQKSLYYEQSLRIPLIIAGPVVRTRGETKALVQLSDLAPTMLEIAGVDVQPGMQSRSLLPMLSGGSDVHRKFQVSELTRSRMIYDGRFKFIENDDDRPELYDLAQDPQELVNLSSAEPNTCRDLRDALHRYLGTH